MHEDDSQGFESPDRSDASTYYRTTGNYGSHRGLHPEPDCQYLPDDGRVIAVKIADPDQERVCSACTGGEDWNQGGRDWSYQKAIAEEADVDGEIVTDGGEDERIEIGGHDVWPDQVSVLPCPVCEERRECYYLGSRNSLTAGDEPREFSVSGWVCSECESTLEVTDENMMADGELDESEIILVDRDEETTTTCDVCGDETADAGLTADGHPAGVNLLACSGCLDPNGEEVDRGDGVETDGGRDLPTHHGVCRDCPDEWVGGAQSVHRDAEIHSLAHGHRTEVAEVFDR